MSIATPESANRLIVVVPGLNGRESNWDSLKQRLMAELDLKGSRWFYWDHRVWRSFGLRRAESLARDLAAAVNAEWARRGGYDEVVLIGHSMGGLILRQAYLHASGDLGSNPRAAWHEKVSRIILFAATNRGADLRRIHLLRPVAWLLERTSVYSWLPFSDFLRGSDFITNLRLRWIRYFRKARGEQRKLPTVVQLLGSEQDRIVDPSDSIDLAQFEGSFQFDVPGAGHSNLYRLDTLRDSEARDSRYALIRNAILRPETMVIHVLPTGVTVSKVKTIVIFVLHGIRDSDRDWVNDAANMIQNLEPSAVVIAPNQGYLSALGFLFPNRRRRPMKRFKDSYSQCVASYDSAEFHFLGHSNGTYQLGRSLVRIPQMSFVRVALAGSVLPESYDWDQAIGTQVMSLQNHMSYKDWAVGWLCSGLRGIGMLDIGTGGFFGFEHFKAMKTVCYYPGGHGAPLEPGRLDELVNFVLGRPYTLPALPGLPLWRGRLSRACPWIARLLAIVYVALIVWLTFPATYITLVLVVLAHVVAFVLLAIW